MNMKPKQTTINSRSRRWRGDAAKLKLDRRRKPKCVAVRFNGRISLRGASAAAKWLGVSHTTLFNIVNGHAGHAKETVALIKAEYPDLFTV